MDLKTKQQPGRPAQFITGIDAELRGPVVEAAAEEHRSISNFVSVAVRQHPRVAAKLAAVKSAEGGK